MLIAAFNGQMADIAADEGATLVDVFGALNADITRFIGRDGLHPTEAGYLQMAQVFFQAIVARFDPAARGASPAAVDRRGIPAGGATSAAQRPAR